MQHDTLAGNVFENLTVLEELSNSGVNKVFVAEHKKLKVYNPDYFSVSLTSLVNKYKPDAIWVSVTAKGAEIAPTVACKLRTGLVAHAVDAYLNEEGEYVLPVPAFGGKFLSEELVPEHRPVMASFKAGLFEKSVFERDPNVQVIREHIAELDELESKVSLVSVVDLERDTVPVEKAKIVVCGGLGAATEDTWAKLKEFSGRIGASVGYTRPVIDMGIEPDESSMIGTSGKSIAPRLYIGFGISGASHHLFGIQNAGFIISVNTDENADIFASSNGKGVADCDAVLDALLQETSK